MKRLCTLLTCLLFLFSVLLQPTVAQNSFAATAKQTVKSPYVLKTINYNTLINIKDLCQITGATYVWDSQKKTILITKDHVNIHMKLGSRYVNSTNYKQEDMYIAPQFYKGYLMVPLELPAVELKCDIKRDKSNQIVSITAKKGKNTPNIMDTGTAYPSTWARVSDVQQFLYLNDGFAYGYLFDNFLYLNTPNTQLKIPQKYALLGDVIADNEGNFYIVWGKTGSEPSEETVFISKYSSQGEEIKTTGFKGVSPMGENGNTKIPFDAGNCVSAIGNGCLMVNYAREMYNGHQSNNQIGVNLLDMSPVDFDNTYKMSYTSHSFNQGILWSKLSNQFITANHGDAYSRGLEIDTQTDSYNLFHFYLEANANYDMYIVNETFAQLGNIVETNAGVMLVGASVKSLGSSAKKEKQNLFVQCFNPLEKDPVAMMIGGSERIGHTSMNIRDNQNEPLTEVTDYGVRWLTSYTDKDVVAPSAVVADNKVVIFWSSNAKTYYMVLSETGDMIKPATEIPGAILNSFEQPIYHNHTIYWTGVSNELLNVYTLKLE